VKLFAERSDLDEGRKTAILATNAARLYGLTQPGSGRLGA
jgi:hypothetical protein